MAAFADMLDLQAAVVDFTGDAGVIEVMPRLVQLAEASFDRKIRSKSQITTATVTFTNGIGDIPSTGPGLAEIIGLFDAQGREYTAQPIQIVQDSTVRSFYAIQGSEIVAPGIEGDASLVYYQKLNTISSSMGGSNWLLQAYPGVYLYGVALEAAKFLKQVELATVAQGLLKAELDDLASDDARRRYSRAAVRVVGVTP